MRVMTQVYVDGALITTWTSSGTTDDFESIDLSGTSGEIIEVTGVLGDSEWISIVEVGYCCTCMLYQYIVKYTYVGGVSLSHCVPVNRRTNAWLFVTLEHCVWGFKQVAMRPAAARVSNPVLTLSGFVVLVV